MTTFVWEPAYSTPDAITVVSEKPSLIVQLEVGVKVLILKNDIYQKQRHFMRE
jgi:hypothetical protein